MVSLKNRRQSGRYTPKATIPKKELISEDLSIPEEYDDWKDHRDSQRDRYKDNKLIKKLTPRIIRRNPKREEMNKKQKKLIERRKARRKNNG